MKRGFTLVELLAVIVILAIIAVIAVPIVLDIIDNAEISAKISSANMYLKAVKQSIAQENMNSVGFFDPKVCEISNSNLNCDGKNIKVEVKGDAPNSGSIRFINGEIYTAELVFDKTIIARNASGEIVNGRGYVEKPDLYNETLTPVVYDGNNWVIVSENDDSWYNYDKQEWANAVVLNSTVTKKVGDKVTVDGDNPDALAMYVWIPRYEYNIEGTYGKGGKDIYEPGEININFISQSVTSPSQGYKVHPAFKFGGNELSGIWVGKFELSHQEGKNSGMQCTTTTCAHGNKLRVLPDKASIRNNKISEYWYAIKSMEQENNSFGFDSNEVDSHMIKNSEWGAIAYLTQSKYGKYGNKDYKGKNKEVYINNSNYIYTGRSGGSYASNTAINTVYTSQTATDMYNSAGFYTYDGYLLNYGTNTKSTTRNMLKVASTTGNITGVYDMSGGTSEYVMGVFTNSNGDLWTGGSDVSKNSGFTGKYGSSGLDYVGVDFPDAKYYDVYKASNGVTATTTAFCKTGICYGHALDEVHAWYNDRQKNISAATGPWFLRGGQYNNTGTDTAWGNAGIYFKNGVVGAAGKEATTRPVLVSTESVEKALKSYSNGEVVYFDVETGKSCTNYNVENSLTGYNGIDNRTGNQNSCLKFYAFNDDGSYKINLILDHNTTATTLWNSSGDNSKGPKEVIEQLKSDTDKWVGPLTLSNYETGTNGRQYTIKYFDENYKARLLTANEVAIITRNFSWNENVATTEGKSAFYFDSFTTTAATTCQTGNITGCKYGWLYDRTATDCTTEGCFNDSEVDTSGYWLSSVSARISSSETHQICNGQVSFGVSHHGRIGNTCPDYAEHYGVRPVIEVLKSSL